MSGIKREEKILIAHGGGGELSQRLLKEHILPKLGNPRLDPLTDSAVLDQQNGRLCLTTDAYVVQPIEFPGGDIGRLAVCGTVNDLAVMGARPLALSLALVLEEGLDLGKLDAILASIAESAGEAGVQVVTGDTKVVERTGGGGLTITTAGIGILEDGKDFSISRISPGDRIIVSGNIAEHGLAVMSAREGLAFDTTLKSDVAPLNGLIAEVLGTGADVRFMRDPTRSGLAGVLVDIVEGSGFSVELEESAIPLSRTARHAAEMLGLDPLIVANEGKCVFVAAGDDADAVLAACRKHPLGKNAALVGKVTNARPPLVELITRIGGRRIMQRPYGEELPRIC